MDTPQDVQELLTDGLRKTAEFRRTTFVQPDLRQLFFELTLACNMQCAHCGSRCGEECAGIPQALRAQNQDSLPYAELTTQEWKAVLDTVKEDFPRLPQINITGGEPLLRPDFEEILSYAHDLGFKWGMTTNGTLITPEVAAMLTRCHIGSVSVSVDALETSHDELRAVPGAYKAALEGVQNLINTHAPCHIQITSVFNHQTIDQLEDVFDLVKNMDITSYRAIGIEPIGSALEHPELILTPEDQRYLLQFIQDRRSEGWPISYGCAHYLGVEGEGRVRDWLFSCNSGTRVASITANGDITGCLNIERTPLTTFGNVRKDRFGDVWRTRYENFRRDRSELDPTCKTCSDREFCLGGCAHTWDFTEDKQRMCLFRELQED